MVKFRYDKFKNLNLYLKKLLKIFILKATYLKCYILFIIFLLPGCNFLSKNGNIIIDANINLEHHDFDKYPVVSLNGKWEFYWNQFLVMDRLTTPTSIKIKVPSSWTELIVDNQELPSFGYATYRLKLKMNPYSKKNIYGIRVKDIGTAYKLYWNNSLIIEKGTLGKDIITHKPEYESLIGDIYDIRDENQLIIEVSNFSHIRAGIWSEVEIGLKNELILKKEKSMLPNFISVGALFIMSIYHLTIFSIRKKDYTGLFFGLFCFAVLFRPLTTEDKFLFLFFKDISWEISNKIEYLSLFTSSVLFNMFIYVLYKKIINKYIIFIPTLSVSIMLFGIIIFDTYIFSQFVPYFEFFLIIQCLYVSYLLLLNFLLKENSKFVSLIGFLGFLIFFITIINDILHSQNIIQTENTTQLGLIVFILSQSYLLSIRISQTFASVEKLSSYLKISNRKLISLKKNLESIVEERTRELKEKSSRIELVGRMTSMIVHDLKNPISSIIGFAELADDPDIGKEIRSGYLKTIEIEAYRLSDMSHDILDFVKGEFKIKKEMILVKTFIEEIQRFIYPDIKQYSINLKIEMNYNGIVFLDTDRMRRVVLNIFSNSVDALISSGKDDLIFKIKTYSMEGKVTFEFEDNGPGIPQPVLDKLFQPFVTYGKYNGTGLGMAQVKGIVEAHNGKIELKTSSEGTIFFITLPISREAKA